MAVAGEALRVAPVGAAAAAAGVAVGGMSAGEVQARLEARGAAQARERQRRVVQLAGVRAAYGARAGCGLAYAAHDGTAAGGLDVVWCAEAAARRTPWAW
eukprot:1133762-Prymnesium_polylepis.1